MSFSIADNSIYKENNKVYVINKKLFYVKYLLEYKNLR